MSVFSKVNTGKFKVVNCGKFSSPNTSELIALNAGQICGPNPDEGTEEAGGSAEKRGEGKHKSSAPVTVQRSTIPLFPVTESAD